MISVATVPLELQLNSCLRLFPLVMLRYDIKDPNQMEEIRKMTGICPQHDVLFDELTTKEHLQFFARIRVSKLFFAFRIILLVYRVVM